jgi:hypothetical protein
MKTIDIYVLFLSHQGDKILLFLGGSGSSTRFRWIKATTYNELNQLSYTIAHRLAQYLERQGLMATKHDNLAIADFKCMVVRFISVALQSNCLFKHHSYSDCLFPDAPARAA